MKSPTPLFPCGYCKWQTATASVGLQSQIACNAEGQSWFSSVTQRATLCAGTALDTVNPSKYIQANTVRYYIIIGHGRRSWLIRLCGLHQNFCESKSVIKEPRRHITAPSQRNARLQATLTAPLTATLTTPRAKQNLLSVWRNMTSDSQQKQIYSYFLSRDFINFEWAQTVLSTKNCKTAVWSVRGWEEMQTNRTENAGINL